MLNRTKCVVEGCERLGRDKGQVRGKRRWGRYCETHREAGKGVVTEALPERKLAAGVEGERLAALRRMGEELRAARECGGTSEKAAKYLIV
jgi:hypothetical protein